MKFAILALIGAVAANAQLPEVDVDTQKVDAALKDVDAWAKRHKKAKEEDNKKNLESLAHAAATYKVQEAVNFNKAWKPWVEFEVQFFDAMTVDGNCNQEVCTDCVTEWIMKGGKPEDKAEAKRCCKVNAGCTTNYDEMTKEEKQAFAAKFHTSVENIEQTYKEIDRKTETDLRKGWNAHMERK